MDDPSRQPRVARRGWWMWRYWHLLVGIGLALALNPVQVKAQKPTLRFEHLTVDDGLSQSTVYTILQDRYGFIWVGTADGLNKYDGARVTLYRADPDNEHTLSSSAITKLYEAEDGTLWIGTRDGLNRFDRASNRFVRYRHNARDPRSLSGDRIADIAQDASGALWVATHANGLNRFDPATQTFRVVQGGFEAAGGLLYRDRAGALWHSNATGLYRFEAATNTFTRVIVDPTNAARTVFALCEDQQGLLWVGTDAGLFAYDRRTGTAKSYRHDPRDARSLASDTIFALHVDRSDTLWIGSYHNGLDRLGPSRDEFHHAQHDPANPTSLIDNTILTFYEDRGGLIWIGTNNAGISILNPATIAFAHYTFDPTQPQTMQGRNISALYVDDADTIWAGTLDGGLSALDRSSGRVRTYRHDPADPASLASSVVQAIAKGRADTVWIGTIAGLSRFDRARGTFRTYRHTDGDPASLSNNVIQAVLESQTGAVWVATENGLNRLDPTTGTFTTYRHHPDDPQSLSHNDVTALYEDTRGTIWAGTWGGGLNALDPATGRFRHYRADRANPSALGDNYITQIVADHAGGLWLATPSGAEQLDPTRGTVRHIRQNDGLPASQVFCLQHDRADRIWMGTSGGLAVFTAHGALLRVFTARDGLQSNEINDACARRSDGALLFGGINGFNVFDPEQVLRRAVSPPPVALTAFTVFNQPVALPQDIAALPALSLSWRDTVFAFDFAALDYADPRRNRYAYQLEGFDQIWVNAGERRSATYTNLPGGNYVFRVKAVNSAGVWSTQAVALRVHIAAPPWQTWWAYLLYGLVLCGSVGSYVRYSIRAHARALHEEERRAAKLAAEVQAHIEERDQFFTLSSDLFCVVSTDGYFKRLNPAWETTLGWSRAELYATPYLDFIHPDDQQATLLAGRSSAHRTLVAFENRYRRTDGSYRWLAWSFTLTPERQFVYGVARDVTERKQIEQEQQRLAQVAEGLREVLAVINSNRPLCDILEFIVAQATRLLDVDAGQIYRLEPRAAGEEPTLRVEASRGFNAPYIGTALKNTALTASYRALSERRPIALSDTRALMSTLLAQPSFGNGQRHLLAETRQRFRAMLAVPLSVGGELYGTISLYNTARRVFTDEEITLASAFAAQSALAIENARLREQVERAAVAEERNRLARDLHDSVTQALFSLNMLAASNRYQATAKHDHASAQNFARLGDIAQQALKEMRLLIYQLRSPEIAQQGLTGALRQRLDLVERHAGVSTHLLVEGDIVLAAAVAEQVYRVAQEALNNILKHAHATQIVIRLVGQAANEHGTVVIEIRDDGIGFDVDRVQRGLGLDGMRERAAPLGGALSITSSRGAGTVVRLVLPCTPAQPLQAFQGHEEHEL